MFPYFPNVVFHFFVLFFLSGEKNEAKKTEYIYMIIFEKVFKTKKAQLEYLVHCFR